MKKLIISVDFDNCISRFAMYPKIGKINPAARSVVNHLYEDHTIIINSCRAGDGVKEAVKYLNDNGVKFHYFNENAPWIVEEHGGDTRKIYADLYIDDRNPGPLYWTSIHYLADRLSKPTILCIVGESGSGKSMIADYIQKEYGIKMIESRTTRDQRYEGETGHTFVSNEEFDTYVKGDMIAYTEFGDKRYCCLTKDVEHQNTYVIDEDGLNMLAEKFSHQFNIYSIRVHADEKIRVKRTNDLNRIKRDRGRFTSDFDSFTYFLNTERLKEEVFSDVEHIIGDLFTNKLYLL